MDRPIVWESFWLDDALTRPGKSHAFVRGWTGSIGYRALCGFTPKPDARACYHDNDSCARCWDIANKD